MQDDSRRSADADDLSATLHEVSNALSVVLGWLEMLERGGDVDAELRERALRMASSRARAAFRLARSAIGARLEHESPRSAADLVREATDAVEPLARARGVSLRLEVRLAGELERPSALEQVLTNLLLNAIAVSPAGGTVTVSARTTAPEILEVEVRDAGPGVPEEQRATLFVRGTSQRAGGAGIGLSHAAELTAAAGGALTLVTDGAAPAGTPGATFRVTWPLESGADTAAPVTRRSAQLDGRRVLLCDDDAGVCELLETLLTSRGASVGITRSLEELEQTVASAPWDVALVDASPLGAEFEGRLDALRSRSPATRWVLVSGAPDPGAIAERLGLVWVRKPFEIAEIIDVLTVAPRT